jgi:hypothetical protein
VRCFQFYGRLSCFYFALLQSVMSGFALTGEVLSVAYLSLKVSRRQAELDINLGAPACG